MGRSWDFPCGVDARPRLLLLGVGLRGGWFEERENQQHDHAGPQDQETESERLRPAAAGKQAFQLALVAVLRRELQGTLVVAFGVVAGLFLAQVVLEVLPLRARDNQSVEAERVAEGEAGRPQLRARARRQQRPQVAQQSSIWGGSLKDNAA